MKKTFESLFSYLLYNLKTLFIFETAYRLLGIFLLFPFISFMFQLSIKANQIIYLTNKNLINYLTNYKTILILIFIIAIISFYLLIEFVFLSILFEASRNQIKINTKALIYFGSIRLKQTVFKRLIFVLIPTILFFIVVEVIYFFLGSSLFKIPDVVLNQIKDIPYLIPLLYLLYFVIFLLFIETIHTVYLFNHHPMSFIKAYQQSRQMLKKKRLKMITEFLIVNLLINGLFYLIYYSLVYLVSFIVSIFSEQTYILSIIISTIYAIYMIISLISTIFLIPINFALMSHWYADQSNLPDRFNDERLLLKKEYQINYPLVKKFLIITFIAIFSLNITNFISISGRNRSYSEYFNYPEIVAHRGSSFEAPENTLASFKKAIEDGVEAIELDVRETVDRVPVVIHDSTTKRTTNDVNNSQISRVTYDYLSKLDAGSHFSLDYRGEKIPTLGEVLSTVKGQARLFIELKSTSLSLMEDTLELLVIYDVIDDSVIMSFDMNQLERIKTNYPEVKTMLLVPMFYGNIDPVLAYSYIDYYGFSYQMILSYPEYIEKAHQLDKSVYAWTVNTSASILKVVNSDVDGIITDKPNLAKEISLKKNLPSYLDEILNKFIRD